MGKAEDSSSIDEKIKLLFEILKSIKDRRLELLNNFTRLSTSCLGNVNDLCKITDLLVAIIKQIDEEKSDLDVKTLDYLFRCLNKEN